MQQAPAQDSRNLEMSLREHLLAAGASGAHPSPYPPPPAAGASGLDHPYQTSGSASPHDPQHLDSNNVAGQHMQYGVGGGDDAGDDGMSPQSGKGKRELSTSKRAAQNRAAQRAFRQRKEGYIKKLEEQVKDLQTMESNFRALQNENYSLREYILNLQSRLLETQSEFPAAPSHINLHASAPPPAPAMSGSAGASTRQEPQRQDGMSHLRAAAAQASDMRQNESPYGLGGEYAHKRPRPDETGGSTGDARTSS